MRSINAVGRLHTDTQDSARTNQNVSNKATWNARNVSCISLPEKKDSDLLMESASQHFAQGNYHEFIEKLEASRKAYCQEQNTLRKLSRIASNESAEKTDVFIKNPPRRCLFPQPSLPKPPGVEPPSVSSPFLIKSEKFRIGNLTNEAGIGDMFF